MGTTAEKLTYLNTTKGKIKDSINLTGVGITNQDTFRSYASKLKLGLIDIINNGTDNLYSNFPKVSGIGSNLSLTPTYEAPMRNLPLGNTLQDGTPTPDTPIEIQSTTGLQNIEICGKNLLLNEPNTELIDGVSIIKNDDGSITLNGTTTANGWIRIANNIKLKDGKYTLSIKNKKTGLGLYLGSASDTSYAITQAQTTDYKTFTLNEETTFDVARIRIMSGTVFENFTIFPQLEQGSNATEYEEYKGNTYEVNLGKNLLDIQGIVKGRLDNGVIGYASDVSDLTLNDNSFSFTTTANYRGVTSDYIKVNNTKYVFSNKSITFGSSLNIVVACYDNSKTFLSNASLGSINLTYMVATLPSNTSYIRVYLYLNSAGTITIEEPQLEKGSSSTSYSPYFTPYEFNKTGDYRDSIKKSTGKNLFDKTAITDGKWLLANGNEEVATQYCISDFIPIIENEQYYLPKTDTRRLKYYDSNKQPLTTSDWDISSGTEGQIINVPSNAKYVRFTIHKTVVDINTFMFNKGSTALSYEPYGKVWYIEKQIGKVVLDGSETPSQVNTSSTNTTRVSYNHYADGSTGNGLILCNILSYASNWSADTVGISYDASNGGFWFRINKTTIGTTQTEVQNWLSSHNLISYIALSTPTYTTITNTELINQLETLYTAKSQEGTTNISITSEYLPMSLSASALEMTD